MKADFLYIGPPKSGSTWLYKNLSAHHQIYMPRAKDIYFFDRYYEKGEGWYNSHFEDGMVNGEISHDYLFSEEAVERIYCYNKDIKLIGLLRDPVERSFSHYKFSLKHGNVKGSLEKSVSENKNILELSRYEKYLPRYLDKFPKENVLLIDFSRIYSDPESVLREICRFLGVDIVEFEGGKERVNPAKASRSFATSFLAKRVANMMRRLGFHTALGLIKHNKIVNKVLYKDDSRTMSIDEKKFLQEKLNNDIEFYNRIFRK